jgi:hypothetical protein
MKIYTFYTESHSELYEIFYNQLRLASDSIELVTRKFPQECAEAAYLADGWQLTMHRKVEYILEALEETPEGEWFVHSDCDIALFDGWTDIHSKYEEVLDMMIQDDYSMLCAGFFFCKSNGRTKALWTNVLNNLHRFDHDQTAMNAFIKHDPTLKVGTLPPSYFTYGYFGQKVWNGEEFEIPELENLKMFHANWTSGVPNKLKLMKKVIKDKNYDYFQI